MTGTMDRASFEAGGFVYEFLGGECRKLPDNVAFVRFGPGSAHVDVTWDQVMAERRQRQAERLERILCPRQPAVLPCYVWTFFNRQSLPFGGWYCYVVTRHFEDAVNFRGFGEPLALSIMNEIPLGILPTRDNFEAWMAAFARAYPRSRRWPGGIVLRGGKRDPRKSGVHFGWLKNRETFSLRRPSDSSVPSDPSDIL